MFIEVFLKVVLIILGNCNLIIININLFRIYIIIDYVLDDIVFDFVFFFFNFFDDNENIILVIIIVSIFEILNIFFDIIYIINGVRI